MNKYNLYLNLKEVDLEEFNFIVLEVIGQFYDDRLFEIYNLSNTLSSEKLSFVEYKTKLEEEVNKKTDIERVKKDTSKALEIFVNSLRKEGEKNE